MEVWLVLLGGGLSLSGSMAITFLQSFSADRRRRKERSEAAAIEIIGLMDSAQVLFRGHNRPQDDGPDDDEVDEICRRIDVRLHEILPDVARQEVQRAVRCLRSNWVAASMTGRSPSSTAWVAREAVNESLSHCIRGEQITSDSELKSVHDAIEEWYELQEEAHRSR